MFVLDLSYVAFVIYRHEALVIKNLPASEGDLRDMCSVLGWGRFPEEGVAFHYSILAWRIPWTDETGRLQSIVSQRIDVKKSATLSLHTCT